MTHHNHTKDNPGIHQVYDKKTNSWITIEDLENKVVGEDYYVFPGTTVTVCLLKLQNGFTIVGEAEAVSVEYFDAETGRKIARQGAVEKMWDLEEYLIKEKLFVAIP